MRLIGQALCLVALVPLAGYALVFAAGDVTAGSEKPRHGRHSPAWRKAPQRVSDELRTLNGFSKPWREWEHATGDWGTRRSWLDERGITPEATYTGEVFSNLSGGIKTGTRYRGNLDVNVTIDSEKLGLWSDGSFFLYFQHGHGEGITEKLVGDIQVLSNIDDVQLTQLSEYWLDQRLLQGRLRLKLGKQDANADFSALDYGGGFINSSFGVIPTAPIPTFPDPALGAVAFLDPQKWMTLRAGVYDGDSHGGTSGFDTAFDDEGGAFGIIELHLRTSLADERWAPGTYRVGLWYHSGNVEELSDAQSPETFSGNHGFYLALDQLLLKEEDDPADEQGLGAFAQFGWAPEDRNQVARYVGGGFVYTGPVPTRDQDALGVAVAHARFSDRVRRMRGLTYETAVEVFYKVQITPWLSMQPDLQFVANPGGDGKEAVAAGLRFAIDL